MIFDRPTILDLEKAVLDFLKKEIKTPFPNHLVYKTQIEINVLTIFKRKKKIKE